MTMLVRPAVQGHGAGNHAADRPRSSQAARRWSRCNGRTGRQAAGMALIAVATLGVRLGWRFPARPVLAA
ncbi:hypothetical protein EB233_11410 [Mesorhizobium erdmanii]|uniref:Uncharacterized protein n=1 Tax=Mesorhizobium erdmanii TaxID=1777866 RepID=A0A6M7UIU8_9HYPH|nr:hypothetical protein EB233_11410 [Mesorhizobium erdmanii]